MLELGDGKHRTLSWGGFASWVAWRSAYLTRLGTMKHRFYVAGGWRVGGRQSPRGPAAAGMQLRRSAVFIQSCHRPGAPCAGDWALTLLFGRDISRW